ncbi:MAG: histidine kinase, partial [Odoribacter sp.]|nr:histidine kinase [Odoribacter sp.]
MQRILKYTSWKVVCGYILLFLLSILGAILIYKQITQFIHKENSSDNSNQKLFIIGNVLTSLYESEALSNAFVQTGVQSYFQRYMDILTETEAGIHDLKTLTTRKEQYLRIDTISHLLEKKVRNLQELAQVKQSLAPDDFYSKAIADIEARRDSAHNRINIRERLVTTIDTSYIKPEKKKRRWLFFKAKQDSILQVSQSQHTIIDT